MQRTIQINLHHAKAATAAFAKKWSEVGYSMALIQEPWISDNAVLGLGSLGKLLYNAGGTKPRACIVFNKNTQFLPIPYLCTDDLVAAYVVLPGAQNRKIIACSAYMPGEEADPTLQIGGLVDYCEDQEVDLLLGCDCNSHHTSWGSTNINPRGEFLHDFLLSRNLTVLNVGHTPTFVTSTRKEVLDITLCSAHLANHITGWHVSDDASLSDHRYIRFDILTNLEQRVESYRNPKKTDWDGYRHCLKQRLDAVPKAVKTLEQLEYAAETVSTGIVEAYQENCPLTTRKSNRDITWWSGKLQTLRQKARSQFNRAKKDGNWKAYSTTLTGFNKELRKAKRRSWGKFCAMITGTAHVARLHKILARAPPSQLGLLRNPDGTFTHDAEETLKLLASVHFPGSVLATGGDTPPRRTARPRPCVEDWRRASLIVKPQQVSWAIDNFKPYKSAGEDGIFPALLQQGRDILLPVVIKIFRASLAWRYIPRLWTKVRVIFIPKGGDKDKSQPKSYRPISLTSFLLKTMEKVVNLYVRETFLRATPLHTKQHAYQKGKSTETALLELTDRLERALEDKEIALCAFLDIEGAFDNTSTEVIVRCLQDRNIDDTTVGWIEAMLTSRLVTTTLLDSTILVRVTRGCPQGGVLSPLLWSIVVDGLIHSLNSANLFTQGYADDLVVHIVGKCPATVSSLMQNALKKIERWCCDVNLSVNANKTVIVPFTRRRALDGLKPPKLFGKTIDFSQEVKYLGVHLDKGLNWDTHIGNVIRKAKAAIGICCRLTSTKWV